MYVFFPLRNSFKASDPSSLDEQNQIAFNYCVYCMFEYDAITYHTLYIIAPINWK